MYLLDMIHNFCETVNIFLQCCHEVNIQGRRWWGEKTEKSFVQWNRKHYRIGIKHPVYHVYLSTWKYTLYTMIFEYLKVFNNLKINNTNNNNIFHIRGGQGLLETLVTDQSATAWLACLWWAKDNEIQNSIWKADWKK